MSWQSRASALARGSSRADALADAPVRAGELARSHRDATAREAGLTGELLDLLTDEAVTDVLVNPDGSVVIERAGELAPLTMRIEDTRALAVRLAASAGRRLDDAAPIVDGTIIGNVRLHAILSPLVSGGAAISLRTARHHAFSLNELAARGALHPRIEQGVRALLSRGANVVISGATGTGKTTLLSALLASLPAGERLLIIEESHELRPPHPHVVALQSRTANTEGRGAVTLSELVRAALRMRPDRLVLGEARGAEIRDVLAALNTGHAGCWFTLHANSAADVPARLLALGALAGLSEAALAAQAAAALDAIVHLRRDGPRRYVAELSALQRRGSDLTVVPALHVSAAGELTEGPGLAALSGEAARTQP